jgi:N-acylglucosamine 2-epimerase
MEKHPNFTELLTIYKKTLIDDIVPFWMKHGIDHDYGGIFNCIKDDGTIINTDKYLWSQGRALWTFSALYNRIEKKTEWLEIAKNLKNFLLNSNGRDKEGAWAYALSREGEVLIPPQSIYADSFVMLGLIEFARATQDEKSIDIALKSYNRVKPLLKDHSTLKTEPNRIPKGYEHHGPKMIYSLVSYELGSLLGDKKILKDALDLANKVMNEHFNSKLGLVHEFITYDKKIVDNDIGMTVIPGHAIESMWFFAHIYKYWKKPEDMKKVLSAIRSNLEFGWDDKYGGIYLAKNIKGGKAEWWEPEAKVWWVFTEAMYALLLAQELLGEEWCMDWYWKVHNYAFAHFSDNEHGEWTQNLDRKGNKIPVVTSLKVKDFFHLPRALIMGIECLQRIIGNS